MKKIIALDIGGTNTRVALINEEYKIESILINPTVVGNLDLFLESVKKTILEGVKDFTDVIAISAGVPGRVRHDGFIYALPNIHISSIPLSEYLEKEFHLPVFVRNDAEVAALSEANVGPYKNYHSLYFVTISTGVGGALCIDGKLWNSSYEIGHTMTAYHNEIHEFEHMASGTGIRRLCDMNGLNIVDAREFFNLVKNDHPLAKRVYKDWIKMLSEWFEMVQDILSPEIFTLTGGVMKSKDLFLEDLRRACPNSNIQECACGQEAGLIGAAVFGFQKALQ
ncbi:MAG: ROK family protein [Bacilli bacterium]|nr:ROK family protein [Bacilli bacterium]MDY6392448.1 ROK family protein [Bacilli bacterium]